jgi:sporulation-control protein spo0M
MPHRLVCKYHVSEEASTATPMYSNKLHSVESQGMRLHNEECHDLYLSGNIIVLIKSKRLRLAGHVARVEDKRVS